MDVQTEEQLVGIRGWLLLLCITLFLRAAACIFWGMKGLYSNNSAMVIGGLMYFALSALCVTAGISDL